MQPDESLSDWLHDLGADRRLRELETRLRHGGVPPGDDEEGGASVPARVQPRPPSRPARDAKPLPEDGQAGAP